MSEDVLTVDEAEKLLKGKSRVPQPWHTVGYCIPDKRFVMEGDLLCPHFRAALDAGPDHRVARLDDRAVLERAA